MFLLPKSSKALVARTCHIILFAALCFALACQRSPEAPTEDWKKRDEHLTDLRKEIEKLEVDIRKTLERGRCELSTHCDAMGVGPILCGKRKGFVVYSVRSTDTPLLKMQIDRFNAISEELNKSSYQVLACGVNPPEVACIDGKCIVKP